MPSEQVINSKDGAIYTTSNGNPIFGHPYASQRIGPNGPLVLQDFSLIDSLAHFDRERIPERVVHAKGAGAHGTFTVTQDVTDLTSAKLFSKVGNTARTSIRFSTVGGESGSADTARDPRGFAVKVRTEEGNWDIVANNTPVFFIRDPAKFAHFIHTQKRDPQTHLKDPDAFWDYLSQNPESIHQVCILFSDRGTPDGYHHMHGYAGHTFKWVNKDGKYVYTQLHIRADKGFKTLSASAAGELAGSNPDYGIQNLFETIEKGDYPSWTVYVQTMTPEQAEKFRYNILDLTKVWSHKEFPLREVGKIVLNENAQNYFAEIEQIAFSPSHLIPGIEPTADPVLQSRLFSYPDTHRHRLGVNYQQLPVNAPVCPVANFQRDGYGAFNNQGPRPGYQSTLAPLTHLPRPYDTHDHEIFLGAAAAELSEITELDFEQPRALVNEVMDEKARANLISNIASHLGNVKQHDIKARQLSIFAAVDQNLSDAIAKAIGQPSVKPLQVKSASEAIRFSPSLKH
jgi:catalase